MSEGPLIDVTLHDVGEGLAEAQIVEWLVAPGQRVVEDQSIVVIATDKANVELPAPASGVLHEQLVSVGTTVALGALLARIRMTDAAKAALPSAAPSTRRLARELRVDLTGLAGSGPQGRILDDDVRKAAVIEVPSDSASPVSSASASLALEGQRIPLNRLRLATARATAAAWREIPHIVEFRQIDATVLKRAREAHLARAEREGLRLTFLPFFVRATCLALAKHPSFNARLDLDHQELVLHPHCNIGVAAASEEGLMVPVLHHAEGRSVFQLARALDTLIGKARNQALSPTELAHGTFTITNFGSYGTWLGTPIVRAPEAAIVGFGRIQEGVLAVEGAAVVRPILPIAVATDHRVNDGIHLAGFLDTLAQALGDFALMSDNPGGDEDA